MRNLIILCIKPSISLSQRAEHVSMFGKMFHFHYLIPSKKVLYAADTTATTRTYITIVHYIIMYLHMSKRNYNDFEFSDKCKHYETQLTDGDIVKNSILTTQIKFTPRD